MKKAEKKQEEALRENSEKRFAALYARVSTDAQFEDGYSIDAQHDMLISYCNAKQFTKYELYTDGGFSGSSMNRPALQRMLSDVRCGKIEHVIVYKLDRLSRSQKDTLYMIEDVFNPAGTGFISLNENMDTSTPIGRAMLGIMSAFAQLERETIRERTRIGMKERVKSGLWMGGGKTPFGYDYDREKGILVPNNDADTVRQIYRLYTEGWSLNKIAEALGLEYEHLARQILLRRTNTGCIVYNGIEYPAQHEAIISRETYEKALELYRARSRENGGVPKHLLAGLVVCGVCGAKMRYQLWNKKNNRYKIYCYSQDSGKKHITHGRSCDNSKIWADKLEEAVIDDIFNISNVSIDQESYEEKTEIEIKPESELINTQLKQCERRLKKLYNLYAADEGEVLRETINETKSELDSLRKRYEEAKTSELSKNTNYELYNSLKTIRETWKYMTFDEKRQLLYQLIDCIIVKYDDVDIHYRHGLKD